MKKETLKAVYGLERNKVDFTAQKRGCVFDDKRRRSRERITIRELRSYM